MRKNVKRFLLLTILMSVTGQVRGDIPEAGQRMRICLNGEWNFQGRADIKQIPGPGSFQGKMRVPGSWRYRGGQGNIKYPGGYPGSKAWYQLKFDIPTFWNDGRIVKIQFDGVNHYAKVFLNGKELGEHYSVLTSFAFDITNHAKYGEANILQVFVHDYRKAMKERGFSDASVNAFRLADRQSGIHRDVYLTCHPTIYVKDSFVMTSFRQKRITVRIWINNLSDMPRTVTLESQIDKDGKKVLDLDTKTVTVKPGATEMVEISREWKNPQLWGFGQWGSPVLYFLRNILKENNKKLDTKFTRFGFREFWCQDGQFWLNGKKIFVLGDVPYLTYDKDENRYRTTALFRGERNANITLLRTHTFVNSHNVYDVADELGMLIEPEFGSYTSGAKGELVTSKEFIEYEKSVIKSCVTAYRNHPSIVIWSDDNEAHSSENLDVEHALKQKDLHETIRECDPTRPNDSNANCVLFKCKEFGINFKPNIFNVHPYGDPSYPEVKRQMINRGWDGKAPVFIGEMTCKKPVLYQTAANLLKYKSVSWRGYEGIAKFWCESIITFFKSGLAGCSPHTMNAFGYWGPVSKEKFVCGPWNFTGKSEIIEVPWPSLSGPGTKIDYLKSGKSDFNWFDPKKPVYTPNILNIGTGKAYKEATGYEPGKLNPKRSPEMIVNVTKKGKVKAGVNVFVIPLENQSTLPQGVMTDKNGRAWFVFKESGKYRALINDGGKWKSVDFTTEYGKTYARAGYENVGHVDLKIR